MRNKQDLEKYWNRKAQKVLEGRTIVEVFYMSSEEADENFGWYSRPVVMRLNDGTEVIVSADDEGNDGGSLFYTTEEEPNGVLPTLS
jgi:formylmethanofuran dehydrogenase subunit C